MGLHFLNVSPFTGHLEALPFRENPMLLLFRTEQSQSTIVCSESTGLQNAEKCPSFLQISCLVGDDQTGSVGKQRGSPEGALHLIAGHLTKVWVPLDTNDAEGRAVPFLPRWPHGSPKQGLSQWSLTLSLASSE